MIPTPIPIWTNYNGTSSPETQSVTHGATSTAEYSVAGQIGGSAGFDIGIISFDMQAETTFTLTKSYQVSGSDRSASPVDSLFQCPHLDGGEAGRDDDLGDGPAETQHPRRDVEDRLLAAFLATLFASFLERLLKHARFANVGDLEHAFDLLAGQLWKLVQDHSFNELYHAPAEHRCEFRRPHARHQFSGLPKRFVRTDRDQAQDA